VIEGIGRGCELANCALLGGETAEMPGLYAEDDYDLAGFCVGIAEHDALIDNTGVTTGDTLIGFASSGPHSNGYSLIRKVLSQSGDALSSPLDGSTLAEVLLEPTRIYVRSVLALLAEHRINAMAHITGGGLTENIPRVLPEGACAQVHLDSWTRPAVFDWLARAGGIDESEMRRTFNCGIGFVLIVPAAEADAIMAAAGALGETAFAIGEITASESGEQVRFV